MEIVDIKNNIEKILDNNKAKSIISINLNNKSFRMEIVYFNI